MHINVVFLEKVAAHNRLPAPKKKEKSFIRNNFPCIDMQRRNQDLLIGDFTRKHVIPT